MLLFVVTQHSKYSKLNSCLLLLNKKMLSGSLTAKKIDFRQCFSLILSKVKIFPCFTNSPSPNSPKERFPDPEISRLRQPPSSSFLTNPQEKRKQETPRRTPFCLLVVIIIWQFYPLEPLSAVVLCVFLFFPRQLFTRILFYFPSQGLACLRHTHTTPKTDSFVLGSPFSWWNKFSAHNIYRIGLF